MRPFGGWPIRVRLVLGQALVSGLLLAALGVALVVYQRDGLRTTERESLELTARVVADRVQQNPDELSAILAQVRVPGEFGELEVVGAIVDRRGVPVEAVGLPVERDPLPDEALRAVRADGHWHGAVDLPGRASADMVVAVRLADDGSSSLVLGQTLEPVDSAVRRLAVAILLSVLLALIAAIVGGYWVARRALMPVDTLTRRAASLDPGAGHSPLPVPDAQDEIARLATTLNAMIDRLHAALDAERRFAADASHELRTPLGVIALEIDVALKDPELPSGSRPLLQSLRAEVTGLTDLVNDLLVLARFEGGGDVHPSRMPGDLREVCAEAIARVGPYAEERGVRVELDGASYEAEIDRLLLRQAVGNIVTNAIGHSPTGSSVAVTLRAESDQVILIEVTDQGPGLTDEVVDRIFDRHHRGEGAPDLHRARTGLGLEITRRIVEAHGGEVRVGPAVAGGSTFTLAVPTVGSVLPRRRPGDG